MNTMMMIKITMAINAKARPTQFTMFDTGRYPPIGEVRPATDRTPTRFTNRQRVQGYPFSFNSASYLALVVSNVLMNPAPSIPFLVIFSNQSAV